MVPVSLTPHVKQNIIQILFEFGDGLGLDLKKIASEASKLSFPESELGFHLHNFTKGCLSPSDENFFILVGHLFYFCIKNKIKIDKSGWFFSEFYWYEFTSNKRLKLMEKDSAEWRNEKVTFVKQKIVEALFDVGDSLGLDLGTIPANTSEIVFPESETGFQVLRFANSFLPSSSENFYKLVGFISAVCIKFDVNIDSSGW